MTKKKLPPSPITVLLVMLLSMTAGSLATVFAGKGAGYPPCTAEACIALLDHYGIDLQGKRVAVIGRSLVIGKPVSMMLQSRNATVTMCHTKTADLAAPCSREYGPAFRELPSGVGGMGLM